MSSDQRTVYFISDSTGITVEMLGQGILSQFNEISFLTITVPFRFASMSQDWPYLWFSLGSKKSYDDPDKSGPTKT